MNKNDRAALQNLLRQLVDGGLTSDESEKLASLLSASDQARREYLNYIQLHTELTDRWGAPSGVVPIAGRVETKSQPAPVRAGSGHSWRPWAASVTTFFIGVLVASLWHANFGRDGSEIVAATSKSQSPDLSVASSGITSFVPKPPAPQPISDAAVVVRAEDIADATLVAGSRLKPGVLNLDRGTIQLEFLGGAMLAVKAPARLQIDSRNGGTLLLGRAIAHVPERARGFVLNAPSVSVVDLDTDFSLHVNEQGEAEVGVLRGELELSLQGKDDSAFVSRRLNTSDRIRVDEARGLFTEVAGEADQLMPKLVRGTSPLKVGQDYVETVLEDGAVLYWRFETMQTDEIPNIASPDFTGRVVNEGPPESRGVELVGHAQFQGCDFPRYIVTDRPLVDLNLGEYSIEFWMNPNDLRHASCVGIVPDLEGDDLAHLNVFEVVDDTFPIYQPGAIRFLHRNPPGKFIQQGLNLISPGFCTPSTWQHVVAVKRMDRIELYFDGALVKSAPLKGHHGDGSYHLIVGQLKPMPPWRQFGGGIDELAVYRRGLTSEEIRRHYDLVVDSY
ncbi:MAG: LamG domain-containing protein [Planctomycetota bacterium]